MIFELFLLGCECGETDRCRSGGKKTNKNGGEKKKGRNARKRGGKKGKKNKSKKRKNKNKNTNKSKNEAKSKKKLNMARKGRAKAGSTKSNATVALTCLKTALQLLKFQKDNVNNFLARHVRQQRQNALSSNTTSI